MILTTEHHKVFQQANTCTYLKRPTVGWLAWAIISCEARCAGLCCSAWFLMLRADCVDAQFQKIP